MRERGNQKKIQLQSILLTDGTTADDYLAGEPAAWRKTEEAAIFACLEKGCPLHVGNIQYMARELQLNKKPSFWSRLKKRLRLGNKSGKRDCYGL